MDTIELSENLPVTRVARSHGWLGVKFKELWEYRELLYFLVWRDLKVRYKQTVIGAMWAIIQPFCTMIIFSVFFGKLAKMPSDGLPYPIFSYAALVPWSFFANSMTRATNSLVGNSGLVKKIYFPRLCIPIGSLLSGLIDFALAFIVLVIMIFYYGHVPTLNIVWLPLLFLLACVTSLGVGLWLSALSVQFRDVQYILPFLVQFWMYATPVAYPSSLLSEPWRTIYGLNPMVGVVEGFRWALLGTKTAPGLMIFVSSLVATILLFSGILYFRKMESTFADVI